MVFSGITFLMYFLPLFFVVYFLLPNKTKNLWIVISSVFFYSWGAPIFIMAVLLSCFIDYIASNNLQHKYGKIFYYSALVLNVAMLGYFKYADFFIENFNLMVMALTGRSIPLIGVVLPIGISFLTFQKISYLVDVHRKDCKPQENYFDYVLFVLLFPQLIAGPIVRYKDIELQIKGRFTGINFNEIYRGLAQFIIGLSKKVFLANILGSHADSVFNNVSTIDLNSTVAWSGILAYTFQIYFDFSGYSDMAIGLGRMMGFHFPENFNFPYSARSITEFWRRWHMTLGSWMKDYLYIPLGGNKNKRTYINLLIVFLISGLWHGASWNFVLWGAFHGSFLVFERLGLKNVLTKAGGILANSYTFLVVLVGWILFRSPTVHESIDFLSQMVAFDKLDANYLQNINPRIYLMLTFALLFSFVPNRYQMQISKLYNPLQKNAICYMIAGLLLLGLYFLNLGELMATGFNPFIYFRF
jgi:alginate O-acetyltransferase complex protein AlgI